MDDKVKSSPLLPMIRAQVKERLMNSPAFRAMPPDRRAAIAHDTVNALHYIAGGEDGTSQPQAVSLAGNSGSFQPAGGQGDGFGRAARTGSQAFTDMIADVNFPAFVAGLIDGVFNSIVTSSIKQMEAYAELVKNVSKSVDQYMRDNVSEGNARDYLLEKYPDHLDLDTAGERPKLKPKEGADDGNLPDFFADLGLKAPVTSLDEDNVEQELVPAARRRIAMDRQQLLATMVMMGVNRLVVTNGSIEASCMFELDTTDLRTRHEMRKGERERESVQGREWGSSGSFDRKGKESGGRLSWKDGTLTHAGYSGDYDHKSSWFNKGSSTDTAKFKMTTVSTSDSTEKIEMHAKLGGKVKVNFKSDYFPMEKMVDVLQINQIRDKSAAGIAPAQPPAQAAPPPPPPLPAFPTLPAVPAVPAAPAAPAPAKP